MFHVNQTPLKVPRPSQEVAMAIRIEIIITFCHTKTFFMIFKMFSFWGCFSAYRPTLIYLTRQKCGSSQIFRICDLITMATHCILCSNTE